MWRVLKLKKIWIPLLIVIIIVGAVSYARNQGSRPQYTTATVAEQNLKQTVSVTGTVEAAEDIELNFKTVGRLATMPYKVGDLVKVGDLLASLEASDSQAAVLTAQAQLQQAEASLDKLKAGSQEEDIAVYQAAVDVAKTTLANTRQALVNTKASQQQAVDNAWSKLVGLPAEAIPDKDNTSTVTIAVYGTYIGSETGTYIIRLDTPSILEYLVSGLETGGGEGSRSTSTPLGTKGLRIQFSSTGTFVAYDEWIVEIPNKAHANYATNYAAYQTALTTQKEQVEASEATVRSAEQALTKAEAELALKKAPARSYDLTGAEAAVASAKANLLKAQSDLKDRTIMAPVSGTITKVNYQIGETSSSATPVLVLLAEGNFEIKVQVPEADVAKLANEQDVDITLDAFGSGQHFSGHITFIDPASTVISDVVYYEVTIAFDDSDQRIKPGMTANVDVSTANRSGILVIPLRAVKYDSEYKPFVEVLEQGDLTTREITLGLKGDDGLVEVTAGLQAGELVVTSKTNGR